MMVAHMQFFIHKGLTRLRAYRAFQNLILSRLISYLSYVTIYSLGKPIYC